jgi:hypothetical protein
MLSKGLYCLTFHYIHLDYGVPRSITDIYETWYRASITNCSVSCSRCVLPIWYLHACESITKPSCETLPLHSILYGHNLDSYLRSTHHLRPTPSTDSQPSNIHPHLSIILSAFTIVSKTTSPQSSHLGSFCPPARI